MKAEQKRRDILELCSESEYGSWEFWSTKFNKTKEEAQLITTILVSLVKERKIVPLKYDSINNVYTQVELDEDKLEKEILNSMRQVEEPKIINPDEFYWFEATEDGEKEDRVLRSG